MNKKVVTKELKHVELNFEFSEDCPIELRNYLLGKGYVNYYDDVLMLTHQGELQVGYTKEELQEMYGDEDEKDISESFQTGENEDEY
jgi:hypothetical protein